MYESDSSDSTTKTKNHELVKIRCSFTAFHGTPERTRFASRCAGCISSEKTVGKLIIIHNSWKLAGGLLGNCGIDSPRCSSYFSATS
jgi:hypothetical protein